MLIAIGPRDPERHTGCGSSRSEPADYEIAI